MMHEGGGGGGGEGARDTCHNTAGKNALFFVFFLFTFLCNVGIHNFRLHSHLIGGICGRKWDDGGEEKWEEKRGFLRGCGSFDCSLPVGFFT